MVGLMPLNTITECIVADGNDGVWDGNTGQPAARERIGVDAEDGVGFPLPGHGLGDGYISGVIIRPPGTLIF